MAIDTSRKRLSAVNVGSPWRGVNSFPDGTIAASDRSALDRFYSGLAAANAYSIVAISGSFAWTGYDSTLTPTTHINTDQRRLSVMNVSSPWRGPSTYPTGQINLAGRTSLNHYYDGYAVATVNAYTITCETGVFVWDGEPSFSDFEITCVSGVFTISGSSATIIATRTMSASAGSFAWTGSDAALIKFAGKTLTARSGTYAWTGSDANITRPRYLIAETGVYNFNGKPINLLWYGPSGNLHNRDPGGHRGHLKHHHLEEEDLATLFAFLIRNLH